MSQSSALQNNQQTYERDLANLRKKNQPQDQPEQQSDQEDQENELEGQEENQIEFNPYAGSSGENQGQIGQSEEAFGEEGEQEGQEEEEQEAQHVDVSQREIGDEPPESKDQLIEFLKAKMIQAENQMNTVYMAIQIEREKRDQLRDDLEETKQEILQFYQEEHAFLGEKVQDRVTEALTKAIEDRVQAENEKEQLENVLAEKDAQIEELDENCRALNQTKEQQQIYGEDAQYRINEQESLIGSYNQEITKQTTQVEKQDIQIEELRNEITDMKTTIDTLILSRNKLNHYINEQRKALSRQATANSTGSFQKKNTTHATNEDVFDVKQEPKEDDFWYADAMGKTKPQHQTLQAKKGHYVDVEDMNDKGYSTLGEKRAEYRTLEQQSSAVKLPVINRERGEYLYKRDEFMEDYAKANVKNNPKDKKTYKGMHEKRKGI